MFTRVLLNITKHSVLNILLVFLFILSFAGMTFSSVFVYKTSSFLNTIKDADDFIIITSEEYDQGDMYYLGMDNSDFKTYSTIYHDILKDNKDVKIETYFSFADLEIAEMAIQEDYIDEGGVWGSYVMFTYSYNEISKMFNLDEDHDRTKIYVTQNTLDNYNLNVGDTVTLRKYNYDNMSIDAGPTFDDIAKLEIGGILEPIPIPEGKSGGLESSEEISEDQYMMQSEFAYIPGEIVLELNDPNLLAYSSSLTVTGDDDAVEKIYEQVKDYSNDTNIYYSKDVEAEDLEFFVKIRNFFAVIFISTIAVFAFAILSLNNNIMDRRSDELRLYNVFGLGSGPILVQLIIEKLSLFFMSLIISIPLFLYMLRVGNNVVDKLVQYSLANKMKLSDLLFLTGNDDLTEYLYNGISKIDVSRILIIAVTMFIMIVIICLVIFVQFMLRRNNIINQRRGE